MENKTTTKTRTRKNPIGLTFVVHTKPAHLITAFRTPGHPDEMPLCGNVLQCSCTTIASYLRGGEFDSAGNPMPVCEECKARVQS